MCEATATNHKDNSQSSAKENQINQIKTNSEKSSNKSKLSKKSNQSIKAHAWPKGSCLVIGDSMLEGLDERKMSSKHVVKVRKFPGATTDDMYHYLMPLLQNNQIMLSKIGVAVQSVRRGVFLSEILSCWSFL